MHPTIIGINAYGLLVGLGLAAGLLLMAIRSRNGGLSPRDTVLLGVSGLLFGAFGARLLHWIFVPGDYVPRYAAFLSVSGGFALNGGILFIMATIALVCRARELDFLTVADRMTPSAPLAIAFFRLGCFCNGCCVGGPTNIPWAMALPAGTTGAMRTAGALLHPTQLYAALSAAALFVALLLLERRRVPRGTLYAVFMLGYGLLRAVIDLTRWRDPSPDLAWVLPANQVLNLALALAGAVVLVRIRRRASGAVRPRQ